VFGGSAVKDNCNVCVGGTTGKTACEQDCNSTWGGKAVTDNCGRCVEGTTGQIACTPLMELEEACRFDGVTESVNAGFSGISYVNIPNVIGSEITFDISSTSAKTVQLYVRYANGSVDTRPVKVMLNGIQAIGSVPFESTTAWTEWEYQAIQLNLKVGSNIISMVSLTDAGGANFDAVSINTTGLSKGQCSITSLDAVKNFSTEISPNPFSSELNIKSVQTTDYKVISLDGKLLEQGTISGEKQIGRMLPKGVYLLQLIIDNQIETLTIIKN
jgi:hypothetical protein